MWPRRRFTAWWPKRGRPGRHSLERGGDGPAAGGNAMTDWPGPERRGRLSDRGWGWHRSRHRPRPGPRRGTRGPPGQGRSERGGNTAPGARGRRHRNGDRVRRLGPGQCGLAAAASSEAAHGPCRVLVNNAGSAATRPAGDAAGGGMECAAGREPHRVFPVCAGVWRADAWGRRWRAGAHRLDRGAPCDRAGRRVQRGEGRGS